MRRFGLALIALLIAPGFTAVSAMAAATADPDATDRRVAEILEAAHAVYGVPDRRDRCKPASGDEIVVCVDHGGDQRVPSTAETDPNSRAARKALDGNIPSAPFVGSIRCRKGADGVCRGHLGGAPAPAYYIDVTKLPAPPPGSDAEAIANGEKPAP